MNGDVSDVERLALAIIVEQDENETVKLKEVQNQLLTKIEDERKQLLTFISNNEAAMKLYNDFSTNYDAYLAKMPAFIELANDTIAKLIVMGNEGSDSATNASVESAEKAFNVILGVTIVAFLMAMFIAFFIASIISRPIQKMNTAAMLIAGGDLTSEKIVLKNKDELGTLADSFNTMTGNLREMIQSVSMTSEQVAASSEELLASAEQNTRASEQISETVEELAVGTSDQVDMVKRSSQAMSEMALGSEQIAELAQSVSVSAVDAANQSAEGNMIIQQAVEQMGSVRNSIASLTELVTGLGERSAEIGTITEVINNIARQTNLLALNAAIEAARAGEHGRGFAVVAGEVRKLAEESSTSAQRITDLVQLIQKDTDHAVQAVKVNSNETEAGIEIVTAAGQAFEQISNVVNKVAGEIQEVSAGSEEMSATDVGVDLTGGWYDAGDHVKFGLPMAYSATMLAWSVVEYREGYEQAGQLEEIKDNLKWATDYFVKAHTKPNELWGQVGAGNTDHAWWGPAEVMQMSRPAFKIDASCPGSELAGETAAALASSSIVFRDSDPAYANKLLQHAKELYSFADTYRGKYSDCITDAQSFYNSWTGYYDELAWAATWLYMATNDSAYLSKAIATANLWQADGQSGNWAYTWTQGWDDKHYGAQILLARITSSLNMPEATRFIQSTERNLDYCNEVATDYNAGFTGALAKMNLLFGQNDQPIANFPAPEVKTDEFFVEAAVKASGSNYTEIKAQLNNRSGWPARMGEKLSFRYFVDLSEVYAAGYTVSDVQVTTAYAEGATVSQPVVVDAGKRIYAVTADFTGTKIYPGGEGHYRKEVQFRITGPQGAWNANNDHSFQGLGTGNVAKSTYLPVYDAGIRIYGQEPGVTPVVTPIAPSGVQAVSGNAQVILNWVASSGAKSYTVKRAEVTGESPGSAQVSATPQAGTSVPGMLTLNGTAGNAQAVLTWTAATGAETYKVQRSVVGGAYADVATGLEVLNYTDASVVNGTAYSYRIAAVNASGQTLSNIVTLTPNVAPATTGTLEVQYRNGGSGASGNAVTPQFNLKNTGTQPIDLSTVKLRYYFTKDGTGDLTFWCDYAQIGSTNIEGKFVTLTPAKGTADTVLEISFKSGAGSLAAGAETGVIQGRFSKNNWSNFDQSNDYSYDATKTASTAWNQITGYQGGTKVWGIEP
ncbi:hypothetical protein G195_001864 [Phytophthora kernoviae 00238/432]|uniref:cellulase n=1 Tax=Phytophthora kernoviae 00238/432 TaxID=1284355 RepID=A0A8J4W9V0_9STRA|nr:hypothetical protein G195_001864 [Phytophthora kernoviae 00238/432]